MHILLSIVIVIEISIVLDFNLTNHATFCFWIPTFKYFCFELLVIRSVWKIPFKVEY